MEQQKLLYADGESEVIRITLKKRITLSKWKTNMLDDPTIPFVSIISAR